MSLDPAFQGSNPFIFEVEAQRQARLSAAENEALVGPVQFPGNQFMSGAIAVLFVVCCIGLAALIILGMVLLPGAADVSLASIQAFKNNCSVCMTMAGEKGATGATGAGIQGVKGDKGDPGPTGAGVQGVPGQNGICIPNPMFPCAQGPKGDKGDDGAIGPTGTGVQGLQGDQGIQGNTGATGGNGTQGDKGDKGDTGDPGPAGPMGAFGGNGTVTNINITGVATFFTQPVCLVPMDSSCLGPGGCFDFSMCNLHAQNLYLADAGGANLFVGTNASTGYLQVGDTGPGMHQAVFGRSAGVNAYTLTVFQVYSSSTLIGAANFLSLSSLQTWNLVSTFGSGLMQTGTSLVIGAGTTLTMQSQGKMTITQQNAFSDFTLASAGSLSLSGSSYISVTGTRIILTKNLNDPGEKWYDTNTTGSLACGSIPNTPDTTRQAQIIYTDLVLAAQNPNNTYAIGGAKIITANADGFLRVGPFLEVCGGVIRAGGGGSLQFNDNSTSTLDIRGIITNGDPNGTAVTVVSDFGFIVNVNNTAPNNTAQAGFTVNGGSTFNGNVTINGWLNINNGGIISQGDISSLGMCCTSDERAKTDIQDADRETAFHRIMGLVTKKFRYTPEYQQTDRSVKNETYVGVIAQHVVKDFGYLVHKIERTVGSVRHTDFHVIKPELLYGEIIGAAQHMHVIHKQLQTRVEELEKQVTPLMGVVKLE